MNDNFNIDGTFLRGLDYYDCIIQTKKAIHFKQNFINNLNNDNIEYIKKIIEGNTNISFYFINTNSIILMLIEKHRYDIIKMIHDINDINFIKNCKKFNIDYKILLKKIGKVNKE